MAAPGHAGSGGGDPEAPAGAEQAPAVGSDAPRRRSMPAVVTSSPPRAVAASGTAFGDPLFRHFSASARTARRASPASARASSSAPTATLLTNNHVIETADAIEVAPTTAASSPPAWSDARPETDLCGAAHRRRRRAAGDHLPGRRQPRGGRRGAGDRQPLRRRPDGHHGHRLGAQPAASSASTPSRTTSRPTPRSTRATRAARWSTARAAWSASTPRSTRARRRLLGIGFAIPVSIARDVLEQIVATGEWCALGRRGDPGPHARARRLVRLSRRRRRADRRRPARQPGDRRACAPATFWSRSTARAVRDPRAMLDMVAALPPGKRAVFRVRRGAEELDLTWRWPPPGSAGRALKGWRRHGPRRG